MAKKSPARASKSRGGSASPEPKPRETARNAATVPAFRRVLLKLSGEALLGAKTFGIDRAFADYLAEEIREVGTDEPPAAADPNVIQTPSGPVPATNTATTAPEVR